ncbi:sorting nexin-3 isoform X1 [Lingula anatina]|uniref:Sorting nexin-3 n=2 Tax=Lingula anatina TaxID=7574 RepID=A0A1S3JJW6_LINAN|nr:sorting nexin-3 isoform X1 [Lingula anatina]|eukprot:XP_013410663.1 sorting nexin-3 isoform X1 [Lingula anatina]
MELPWPVIEDQETARNTSYNVAVSISYRKQREETCADYVIKSGVGVPKMAGVGATARIQSKKQTLEDAYSPPANFLEIDVLNAETHGIGKKRFTDYEVRMRTNLPVFKMKESSTRRRYSDFEWLRNELERDSKIVVPPLPGKALKRQLPFRGDDGIFEDEFIEERRKGLEQFVNKVAGHPLAQNERCLHMFLQEPMIDKNYVPGKVRTT